MKFSSSIHLRLDKSICSCKYSLISFKTSVFEKVGLFDTEINHHGIIEWWSRAEINQLQFGEDFETGLFRRIHENNSGNRYMKESRVSLFKILREVSRNYEN